MPERQKYLFATPDWTEIAKAAREALSAWISATERTRLRVVA